MDTLTQAVLGAACGQAFFARRMGRQALGWGAVAGLVPDLDMAVIPVLGPLAEFRYHRSLTHSLFFAPVVAPLLGHLSWRWEARRRAGREGPGSTPGGRDPAARPTPSRRDWTLLWLVGLVTHPLLDWFTTYGTQLLWPFSHRRFALDAVAIIDPLYTLPLALPLLWGLRAGGPSVRAQRWCAAALVATTAFLFYGLHLNRRAEAAAVQEAPGAGPVARVDAYPTLLQPWLRRVVVRRDGGVAVGLLSLWAPQPIGWRTFVEAPDARLSAARATEEGRLMEWFADGQTAARLVDGGAAVEIDDLRYGFGGPPEEGLWGIRVPVAADGRPSGPGVRFNRRPPRGPDVLRALWRGTFG